MMQYKLLRWCCCELLTQTTHVISLMLVSTDTNSDVNKELEMYTATRPRRIFAYHDDEYYRLSISLKYAVIDVTREESFCKASKCWLCRNFIRFS